MIQTKLILLYPKSIVWLGGQVTVRYSRGASVPSCAGVGRVRGVNGYRQCSELLTHQSAEFARGTVSFVCFILNQPLFICIRQLF